METIKCKIQRIRYANTETTFHVLICKDEKEFSAVGEIVNPVIGSYLTLLGDWEENPPYGKQFRFCGYEPELLKSKKKIEKYLASGAITWIGPVLAKRIVDTFGNDTLKILDEEPERLIEVNGIGKKSLKKIQKGLLEFRAQKTLRFFLQEHDISIRYASKIYAEYGDKSVEKIKENPYNLYRDVQGFGFKKSDKIALKLGFEKNSYRRIEAGILYTLETAYHDGHCYLNKRELYDKASELLECQRECVVMTIDEMIKNDQVILDEDAIYEKQMYYSEIKVARKILSLLNQPKEKAGKLNLTKDYDSKQLQAIVSAIENSVSIITGGPGTGKSTIINEIVRYDHNKKVLLAAPTGKAAKRLQETTGKEAMTIHRLLEAKSLTDFKYNEMNPLKGDVLIVDECSMIDIWLMNHLMKAVPTTMKVILVGDKDQLPSVGPGNVLKDLIQSGLVPVTVLTKIYRQSEDSCIALNAHEINEGRAPIIKGLNSDFFFIRKNKREIAKTILHLVTKGIPEFFNIIPDDIQVLAPMKKGENGVVSLNLELRKLLNPQKDMYMFGDASFCEGDRVIQTKNNYEDQVFNGDSGIILEIDKDGAVIDFDGNQVVYSKNQMGQIMLSYALTIHKSQGSEFPVVVMPMTTEHYILLQRNLLYTGITRARQLVFLVGEDRAVKICVKNDIVKKRNTKLIERLNVYDKENSATMYSDSFVPDCLS